MRAVLLLFCVSTLYVSVCWSQKPPKEPIMQCDFDEGLCPGWKQKEEELYQWEVARGPAKGGTGPKYDYNRANSEGGYIYMNDDGEEYGKAIIRTPKMDLSEEDRYCLRFVFFSRGRSPGEIRIFHSNKMTSGRKVSVFFRAGPRSDNNTHWIYEDVTLRSFSSPKSFKRVHFDIQALKGRGDDNVVAIDDFSVIPGECPPFQFRKTATTATFAPSPTNELGEAVPTRSPAELSNEEVMKQNEERIRENEERNKKVQEMNELINSGQYTPTYDPNQPTQPTQPTQPLQPHEMTSTTTPEGSTISEKERQEQILEQQRKLQEEAEKRRIAEQEKIEREEKERKDLMEKKRLERKERHRQRKEEEERKIKETREKQMQEKLRKEAEEKERREKEEQKKKEEQERKAKEKAEREKKLREEHERKKKEEEERQKKESEERKRKIAEEREKNRKESEKNVQGQKNQNQQDQQNQQNQQNQQGQQNQQDQRNRQNQKQGGKRRGRGGKGKRGGGKKVAKKDNPDYVKCGKKYIHKEKQLCCDGRSRKIKGSNMMCCGRSVYNSNDKGCCGGKIFDATGTNQCCGSALFDAVTHACCEGEAYVLASSICVDGEVQPIAT